MLHTYEIIDTQTLAWAIISMTGVAISCHGNECMDTQLLLSTSHKYYNFIKDIDTAQQLYMNVTSVNFLWFIGSPSFFTSLSII